MEVAAEARCASAAASTEKRRECRRHEEARERIASHHDGCKTLSKIKAKNWKCLLLFYKFGGNPLRWGSEANKGNVGDDT